MMVLALDLATQTGVAVGPAGLPPDCWSVDIGKGKSEEVRFSNVLRLTASLIERHNPDLVAIEAAIGGKNASAFLIGLVACVRGCAANRGVAVEAMHLGSIRRHFLGKSLTARDFPGMSREAAKKAIKGEVIKRCQILGIEPEDDNAADAVALHDYACATHARGYQSKPVGGLF